MPALRPPLVVVATVALVAGCSATTSPSPDPTPAQVASGAPTADATSSPEPAAAVAPVDATAPHAAATTSAPTESTITVADDDTPGDEPAPATDPSAEADPSTEAAPPDDAEAAARRADQARDDRREAKEQARRTALALAQTAANMDLQTRLADLGYYEGAIDGVIGSGSETAVLAFQEANDLAVDGVVGAQTRKALAGDPVTAAEAKAAEQARAEADEADQSDDGADQSDDGNDESGDGVVAMGESEARDRLAELGYWGGSMHSALMAFQKVNGLSADGVLGPNTAAALADPRSPSLAGGAGTRLEIDLDQQVVHWISGGSRVRTMNASSGNGETFWVDNVGDVEALTPIGTFTIQRRISGLREGALGGMYDPMYFFHGWAVHGSNSVPAWPASHGCVRLSRSDASWLFERAPNGTPVVIHGSRNAFVPGGPDQPPIL